MKGSHVVFPSVLSHAAFLKLKDFHTCPGGRAEKRTALVHTNDKARNSSVGLVRGEDGTILCLSESSTKGYGINRLPYGGRIQGNRMNRLPSLSLRSYLPSSPSLGKALRQVYRRLPFLYGLPYLPLSYLYSFPCLPLSFL